MRFKLTIVLLWFIAIVLPAQNNAKVYDLLNQLKSTQHDTAKSTLLLQLAHAYYPSDVEKAIGKANLALLLAENYKDNRKVFKALDILIRCNYEAKSDLNTAIRYLSRAKNIDTSFVSITDRASLLGHEGHIYVQIGDYAKAQHAFFEQLKLYEYTKDRQGIAKVNYDLGALYFSQADYLTTVGYYSKAFDLFSNIADIRGKVEALNALGSTYQKLNNFEKSNQYCSDALYLSESINDLQLTAKIHLNVGNAQAALGNIEGAEIHFNTALEMGKSLYDQLIIANVYHALAQTAQKTGKKKIAIDFYNQAIDAAVLVNNRQLLRDIYNTLYQYYDEAGDYSEAYGYLRRLTAVKDSLSSEERNKQFINDRIRFETEQKEEENKQLRAKGLESDLTIQKQKALNYTSLAVLAFVISCTLLLYNAFRQKKKYNEELELQVSKRTEQLRVSNEELTTFNHKLEQSNNELERFAYIASHDLKSPLRNIISFLNLIQRKVRNQEDKDLKEYLRFATENAKQMNVLIQDVLEFSRVESSHDVPSENVDLNESMMMVVQNLQETMQSKNAIVYADALPVVHSNSVQMLQLFQNLVGNGIKYNKSYQPEVKISHKKMNGHHLFCIQDNGIGIDTQYHDQIFEMFKRLHTREEYNGTGIGLAICKKIVSGMGGEIWLDSEPNEGAKFYFTVPAN